MFTPQDEFWMQQAFQQAKLAAANQEVPVGAVLILNEQVIGVGSNCPIGQCDPTAHAEIIALRTAAKTINNYRLVDSTLYVTLEPCVMCMGAIIHARIKHVIFAAEDSRAGAASCGFKPSAAHNHNVILRGGLLAEQSSLLLRDFFRARR